MDSSMNLGFDSQVRDLKRAILNTAARLLQQPFDEYKIRRKFANRSTETFSL
jgi:hypothetical protein